MLFEILTEEVSDGYIENDILGVLKSMSEIAQKMVIDNAEEWPDIATIRSSDGTCFHWTEAEEVGTTDDISKLIFAYTSTFAINNKLDNQVVSILRSMDVWMHILSELGFRDSSNPFPKYVLQYKDFDVGTMRSQIITLNNLFSAGDINADDLRSKQTILYNRNIWALSERDINMLLENYYFIKRNHSKFNPNVTSTARLNEIRDRVIAHPDDMENYVVFTDDTVGDASKVSGIRDAYIVDDFVKKFFRKGETQNKKENDNEADKSSNLEKDKKDLIKKLMQDGKFKYSDIEAIKAYIKELHDTGEIL